MRATKEQWARLSKNERSELVRLERGGQGSGYSAGGMLPDDCSECDACGEPTLGSGLCSYCFLRWRELNDKLTSPILT